VAHNENGEAKMGDEVAIVETRPMSRLKRWAVVRIVRKALTV
jgi:small subunit ribosomal protein S17